jgi:D-alanyl-lipoteichoic acid acyltransferase DltB (MBOAT superfamily)
MFFAVVVTLYYLSPQRGRVPVLLAASALFYISFNPQYIFILLALIAVDYCAGLLIERAESKRVKTAWLVLSVAMNLSFMVAFKYSRDVTGRSLGMIPVGLSFHTFQAMAYTIEVYRGRQPAERSFTVYALYVMFFPQIAAGPIERPQNLLPQFRQPHPFRYADAVGGLQLMAWGMFQKYVVADRFAGIVDAAYARHTHFSGPLMAFAAVCFSFQIYCDFSGYTDIALGAAQVLGFRLTRNFNAPFHADSMAEYWKRWHISLSSWMRDYVFFPLCGKRPHMPRICASIMLVFLANGLWHGARWNFLISGLLHGTYRVVELLAGRAISRAGWTLNAMWNWPVRIVRTVLVFCLMTFAFLFFRGENLPQTLRVVGALFSGWRQLADPSPLAAMAAEAARAGLPEYYCLSAAGFILVIEAVQFLRSAGPLRPRIAALPGWCRWSFYYAAAAAVLLLAQPSSQQFIYFRF